MSFKGERERERRDRLISRRESPEQTFPSIHLMYSRDETFSRVSRRPPVIGGGGTPDVALKCDRSASVDHGGDVNQLSCELPVAEINDSFFPRKCRIEFGDTPRAAKRVSSTVRILQPTAERCKRSERPLFRETEEAHGSSGLSRNKIRF